jgi:hypothetical protein
VRPTHGSWPDARLDGRGPGLSQQSATGASPLPTRPGGLQAQAGRQLTVHCRGCGLAGPRAGTWRPVRSGPSPGACRHPAGRARTVCGHHFKAGVHLHHGAFVEEVGCVQASAVASQDRCVLRKCRLGGFASACAVGHAPSHHSNASFVGVTRSATCARRTDGLHHRHVIVRMRQRTDVEVQQVVCRPHGALLGSSE